MRFHFYAKKLQVLYTRRSGAGRYPHVVIIAFFEVMAVIAAAKDERDFYALKSLHFEKLKGDLRGARSLRLNDQFRLIVTIERDRDGRYLLIKKITDYH